MLIKKVIKMLFEKGQETSYRTEMEEGLRPERGHGNHGGRVRGGTPAGARGLQSRGLGKAQGGVNVHPQFVVC